MKTPSVLKRRALRFVSAGLGIFLFASAIIRAESPRGSPDSNANSPLSQAVEKRALELLATAPVRQAVAQGLKTLEASDSASKPEALRFGRSALEATANEYTEWTLLT